VRIVSTFYSSDHNSVTVTNGTGTNAIISTTFTDTEGRPVLNISYPTNGIIEFVLQQYDNLGRRISRQRCSSIGGTVITWSTNAWTFDAMGRIQSETYKDGAVTTYARDAMGNVTNRAMPSGLTWSATYLNDGRIATEQVANGGLAARSMSYQYYQAGTPFVGRLQITTDGRGTTWTNNYDDFLRLASVNTGGSSGQQQTTTTYQYDLRGLVTNLSQSFVSTNTGPSTAVTHALDAFGRITSETLSFGSNVAAIAQGWDVVGRRSVLDLPLADMTFGYQADGLMTVAGSSTFGFANNGLLVGRTNSSRSYFVNQRDGAGRILQATAWAGLQTLVTENLTWLNNGQLNSYSAVRGDFTDARNYAYSAIARRVTQESFNVATGQKITNSYSVDGGQSQGLGVLTSQTGSGASQASWTVPSSGGLDALSRVAQAQNNVISRSTYGTAVGAGTVSATLDGHPVSVQSDGPQGDGYWRANLELAPGSHTLTVSATDPSGLYSGAATNTFASATNSGDTIQNTYDGNGNITQRFWVNSLGQTNRTQTLTWDAFNRLMAVMDRDATSNGMDWTAVYDALGRRLQTTSTIVVSNTEVQNLNSSNVASTVQSWYDPQVEFLEVGVSVNGLFTIESYGPDINGAYGGMQGLGGLDSVNHFGETYSTAVVQDFFGNAIATVANGAISWAPARFSSYGPVQGYQTPALSPDVPVEDSVGWRGKRTDPTGLIWIGARYYDPVAGRFLSADPIGHAACMDLYSFCDGDPINSVDPDGRLGKNALAAAMAGSMWLEEKLDSWSVNSPEKVRDLIVEMQQARAQQQWFQSLPADQQTAYKVPVPFVFNAVQMADNLAAGNFDAAGQNSGRIATEALATLLMARMFPGGPMGTPGPAMGSLQAETQLEFPFASQLGPKPLVATQMEFPFVADLPTIANPGATLPVSQVPNFAGGFVQRNIMGEGTTLYGVRDATSRQVWWTRDAPIGELFWRQENVVLPSWNAATHLDTLTVPQGGALIGFEGQSSAAAAGTVGAGWYKGQGNQIYIPNVPQNWIQRIEWK
jgi:RHS repeat-associated protein